MRLLGQAGVCAGVKAVVLAGALLAAAALAGPANAGIDLSSHLRPNAYDDLALSPAGTYYATTVAQENATSLVVIRRSDMAATGVFNLGPNSHVTDFDWVSDDYLLVSIAEKFGALETPVPTGELYGVAAVDGEAKTLVGFRAGDDPRPHVGVVQLNRPRDVAAHLLHRLPDDPQHVLIEVWPYETLPRTKVQKMNLRSGRRSPVAEGPVPRASFGTDNAGRVRFAVGAAADNISKLYHRADNDAEWTLVNDESSSRVREFPLGFATDDQVAYLEVEHAQGPNSVVAFDTRTGERRPVLRDEELDPYRIVRDTGRSRAPLGVMYSGASVRTAYFDEKSPAALLQRSLEKGFGGDPVHVISSTDDGRLALLLNWSARNPGDFFLFDTVAKKANRVLSRREWLHPAATAPVEPVLIEARDGLVLHGLLTRAKGAPGPKAMVVMPHGGPFGEFDALEFDNEAQLLAQAGYAVLQVNFRGSGNRGRAFLQAGARQWGGRMQDDVTDATRWAIAQGHADPARICLYGASYGAYASMMGLAREPGLYRCGVGYVGVYDLQRMVDDDARRGASSKLWLSEWVGEGEALREASATTVAARIRAPVLLVAGGRDRIAPIAHTRAMERALKAAGTPVETLYVSTEGHGFFAEDNRRAHYTRLLAFLATHLGGERAN
ncbi:alpha/beta hydrolase family protein [Arenimonas sp. MALMAid1274]|uniref:alpha/beta hydrolase family protein n=1 Tax=Arenimonas sp. MALMAid1274 TaxID=3411630 RepID=UPI003B9DF597